MSSLVQMVAWGLLGAMSSSEPMHWLKDWAQTSFEFESKYSIRHTNNWIRKCLRKFGYFYLGLHDDVTKRKNFPRYWPLCGEFTGPRWIPTQRPVTRSFDAFSELRLIKRLSKQSWGWWFETQSRSLWRHCNAQCDIRFKGFNLLWNAASLAFTMYYPFPVVRNTTHQST